MPACYDSRKTVLYICQLEPGLHIVVTIPEHASDVAPKRILRQLIHRLQMFLENRNMNVIACDHHNYVKTKDQGIVKSLKMSLQPCVCHPYNLHGDQTLEI